MLLDIVTFLRLKNLIKWTGKSLEIVICGMYYLYLCFICWQPKYSSLNKKNLRYLRNIGIWDNLKIFGKNIFSTKCFEYLYMKITISLIILPNRATKNWNSGNRQPTVNRCHVMVEQCYLKVGKTSDLRRLLVKILLVCIFPEIIKYQFTAAEVTCTEKFFAYFTTDKIVRKRHKIKYHYRIVLLQCDNMQKYLNVTKWKDFIF